MLSKKVRKGEKKMWAVITLKSGLKYDKVEILDQTREGFVQIRYPKTRKHKAFWIRTNTIENTELWENDNKKHN